MEFKNARIAVAENGYEIEICVQLKKPSRKDIAEMDSPQLATVEGDTVTDYKKYVAKTLEEAIGYIQEYNKEDKSND